jgi:hypothetical protein
MNSPPERANHLSRRVRHGRRFGECTTTLQRTIGTKTRPERARARRSLAAVVAFGRELLGALPYLKTFFWEAAKRRKLKKKRGTTLMETIRPRQERLSGRGEKHKQ